MGHDVVVEAGNLAPLGTVTETEHGPFCAFIRLRTLRDLAEAPAEAS